MNMSLIKIIITILIILSSPSLCFAQNLNVFNRLEERTLEARIEIAEVDINSNLKTALKLFELDNGFYPTTEQGLNALLEEPTILPKPNNWNGPYIAKKPLDPWGNPYEYKLDEQNGVYRLWSNGPDGIESQDDISSTEPLPYKQAQPLDVETQEEIKDIFQEAVSKILRVKILDFQMNDEWEFIVEGESVFLSTVFNLVVALEDSMLFERIKTQETTAVDDTLGIAGFKLNGRISEEIIKDKKLPEALDDLQSVLKEKGLYSKVDVEDILTRAAAFEENKDYQQAKILYKKAVENVFFDVDKREEIQSRLNNVAQEEEEAKKWIRISEEDLERVQGTNIKEAFNYAVTLDVTAMSSRDVLMFLGLKGKFLIESLSPIDTKITMLVKKVKIADILLGMSAINKFAFNVEDDTFYIMSQDLFKERYGKEFDSRIQRQIWREFSDQNQDTTNDWQSIVKDKSISLETSNMKAVDLLKFLALKGDFNLILDPQIEGEVVISDTETTILQVLLKVKKQFELDFSGEGDTLLIKLK